MLQRDCYHPTVWIIDRNPLPLCVFRLEEKEQKEIPLWNVTSFQCGQGDTFHGDVSGSACRRCGLLALCPRHQDRVPSPALYHVTQLRHRERPPGSGEMPLKRKWSLMTEKTALLEDDRDIGGVLTSVGSGST